MDIIGRLKTYEERVTEEEEKAQDNQTKLMYIQTKKLNRINQIENITYVEVGDEVDDTITGEEAVDVTNTIVIVICPRSLVSGATRTVTSKGT